MTDKANGTTSIPPSAAVPATEPPASSPGRAMTTTAPAAGQVHWSRGALDSAGRLIGSAANDEMVRNMIGSHARKKIATTVFGGTIMGAVAARIATRSVPGALLVGGALIAKAVYDQRKAKAEEAKTKPVSPPTAPQV